MLTRLVLITAAVMATSSAAYAGVIQKVTVKGSQTASFFDASADIDCDGAGPGEVMGAYLVNGFISAGASVFKMKGAPKSLSNGVSVTLFVFNTCTNEFRILDGGAAGIVDPPASNLRSASIDGAFTVQDFGDGSVFPIDLDLDFTGVGDLNKSKFVDHTKTVATPDGPATITHSVSGNANRSATMTGTISVAGFQLTIGSSQNFFNWNANSSMFIER